MRKKSVNGSLTLEFTLLLPVLIMILLLMAQAGLFFYNRCLLKQNAQLLALQLVQEGTQTMTEEELTEYIGALKQYKYLLLQDVETGYSRSGDQITVSVSGRMLNFCSVVGLGDAYLAMREEATCQYMDKAGILGTIRSPKRKADTYLGGEDS